LVNWNGPRKLNFVIVENFVESLKKHLCGAFNIVYLPMLSIFYIKLSKPIFSLNLKIKLFFNTPIMSKLKCNDLLFTSNNYRYQRLSSIWFSSTSLIHTCLRCIHQSLYRAKLIALIHQRMQVIPISLRHWHAIPTWKQHSVLIYLRNIIVVIALENVVDNRKIVDWTQISLLSTRHCLVEIIYPHLGKHVWRKTLVFFRFRLESLLLSKYFRVKHDFIS